MKKKIRTNLVQSRLKKYSSIPFIELKNINEVKLSQKKEKTINQQVLMNKSLKLPFYLNSKQGNQIFQTNIFKLYWHKIFQDDPKIFTNKQHYFKDKRISKMIKIIGNQFQKHFKLNLNSKIGLYDQCKNLYIDMFQRSKQGLFQLLKPQNLYQQEFANRNSDFYLQSKNLINRYTFHLQFIKQMEKYTNESQGFWKIQDYLNTDRKDSYQQVNLIFQLKRKFTSYIYQQLCDFIKQQQQQLQTQDVSTHYQQKQEINKKSEQIQQLTNKVNITFDFIEIMKFSLSFCLFSNRNVQFEHFEKLDYCIFKEKKNQKGVQEQKGQVQMTIFYLILNNKMKKQDFERTCNFFKGVLRLWFLELNLVMHVIGYNPYTQNRRQLIKIQKDANQIEKAQLEIRKKLQQLQNKFQQFIKQKKMQNKQSK